MHWLCLPSPAYRTHHLKIVSHESQLWFGLLAFEIERSEETGIRNTKSMVFEVNPLPEASR